MANFLRIEITGARQTNNIFIASIVGIGGTGFLLAGLSSFLQKNLLLLSDTTDIPFLPQGLTLVFYGTIGLFISAFLWSGILWNVGSGFTEVNDQSIQIKRRNYPFFEQIDYSYNFDEIKSIKIYLQDGISAERQIYLVLFTGETIPLLGSDRLPALDEIEQQALNISRLINVPIITEGVG